ncbi:HD domain-containing protein [bacterium]|nr:HD domain-containing protein [bacterium]
MEITKDDRTPSFLAETYEKPDFIPIALSSLRTDAIINTQLYIKIGADKFVKYREVNIIFDDDIRHRLNESGHSHIYVTGKDSNSMNNYLETNLINVLANNKIENKEKASVLYETTTWLTRELMSDPRSKEGVVQSRRLVENTVDFILSNAKIHSFLVQLSSYDYYTYTHQIDVMVHAVTIGKELNLNSAEELLDLGQSAMLHDVGKSYINPKIIKKTGKLNEHEWIEMQEHPDLGYSALASTNAISENVLHSVRHHHEYLNGTGYPKKLSGDQINLNTQIITCADIYSALTTRRVYRPALKTFPALSIMKEMVGTKISKHIFESFVKVLGKVEK